MEGNHQGVWLILPRSTAKAGIISSMGQSQILCVALASLDKFSVHLISYQSKFGRMGLALRFALPLAFTLGLIAYGVVPLVDSLTFKWSTRVWISARN